LLKKVLYTLENQSNGKREAIRELQPLVAAHKVKYYFHMRFLLL
jgi:hypothetical protein